MAPPSSSISALASARNGAAAKRKRHLPVTSTTASNPTATSAKTNTIELDLGDSLEDEEDQNHHDLEFDDDNDHDEFPEIDVADSDDDDDHEQASDAADEAGEDDDDDDDDDDDQVSDSEEGYNSSDIDNASNFSSDQGGAYDSETEDARVSAFAARSNTSQTSIDEELSRMMSRYTSKPDETSGSLSTTNNLGIPRLQAAQAFDPATRNADGSAKGIFKRSQITGEMKRVYPEIHAAYDSDSSTEDPENRIGNVPLEWYDDLPHIGYDINGRKVMKPATKDELDKFLDTVDGDGEAWFSAKDNSTGRDVRLSDEELAIIRKLQNAEIPDDAYDPYEDYVDWFTGQDKVMQTALTARPEPKSRFVPSKWEHKKVMKIVRAIREGRIVPGAKANKDTKPKFYNIWADAADEDTRSPWAVMAAPKLALPGHGESYNPPAEYLFNDSERKEWEQAEAEDRKQNYLPAKHDSLRHVGAYQNFVQERFERCLDLYLAPRMMRKKLDIHNPENLLPKLPSPKELRPFPTTTSVVYAHPDGGRVRCLSVDPTGNWLVTGGDDGQARLWDVAIGRCTATWDMCDGLPKADRSPVHSVAWCPTKNYSLFAAVVSGRVVIVAPAQTQNYGKTSANPATSKSKSNNASTSSNTSATSTPSFLYATDAAATSMPAKPDARSPVSWTRPAETQRRNGVAMYLNITSPNAAGLKTIVWHAKGDYFTTICPNPTAGAAGLLIHQISKHRSQSPFRKASKGSSVQKAVFHPTKPHLFVATQRYIRIYDLMAQSLIKTLQTGFKWISTIDVHPSGDHLMVGSYDKKLAWFDLDLSNRPFKVLKYHAKAIRAVDFSKAWNLVADASDDGTLQLFYAKVGIDYGEALTLVPLKVLRGHRVKDGLGVLDVKWHPSQPWCFSAGADGNAVLWTT
ncbi:related to ERB1 - Protein required for maturation of the 25S and 5.8S ribosomal RNAs [Melanopsichium pennsylvanicum]|uniref:Ribosome biogenesis protein ERB1 n=2 Tax=Melanopsichium pennsylvanicum TaxID=63383 RepID=A0AAJ5C7D1_9BASI|nr:related to ERB1-Protein required for maturation of the 25S and 5.8S ribosomal RNAs [Melanopsichium pennsylvanicum 4]SNX86792.1 related to ERB1 - Protein required for maturation of the 25S and 5.8S ribosomal RNAs [Melanopsichium pennsylvanicum]